MRIAWVAGLLGMVAGAVALAVTATAAAGGAGRQIVPAAADGGFFRSHCALSHTAPDDPILMPGMSGQSMVHEFFGNTTTTASSTGTTLRAAGTTSCMAPGDTSAYWMPALYQRGVRVAPSSMAVYYRTAGRPAASIQPLPQGLQIIAGNETAMTAQSTSIAYWNCGAKAEVPRTALPPVSCPAGSSLVLSLVFPDCWDGHTLPGAGQKNVAYAVRGRCPAGYPVAIPQLSVHVRYPITSGAGLTLSMGPTANTRPDSIYTAHADVINAWDPTVLASLVERCDVGALRCGTVGPANQPLGIGRVEQLRAKAADRRAEARAMRHHKH
jgi:Domain of unknown function (DUF1996)